MAHRIALVTGASRGIGRACAHAAASLGYSVVCVGRDNDTLESVRCELPEVVGPDRLQSHATVVCDVSSESSIVQCVDKVSKSFDDSGGGTIHALINAAGVVQNGLLARTSDAIVDSTLKTNLVGPMIMCREVSKKMLQARYKDTMPPERCIINIGSIVGSTGNAGQCIYSASKAGLHGLTLSLSQELGPRGIRVNLIEPGFIDTEMTSALSAERKDAIIKNITLGRFGTVEDVASLARFLMSKDSGYVTGQTFRVDGGLSAGLS